MLEPAVEPARVERFASLDEAFDAWSELARSTANIFSTPEWAQSWLPHFLGPREIRLTAIQRDDRDAVILPMVVDHRGSVPVARFIGHGVADQLQPVCERGDVALAAHALEAVLGGVGVVLAERLPATWDWTSEIEGRVIHRDASPAIDLIAEDGWEGFLANRSANFRQQVRRRARRLHRGLGVTFRLLAGPDRLPAALDALIALHLARWGDRSHAFAGARERFHREFAALALDRGWLRLWLAEAEGTPVAAWYGFRFAGVESFYQLGHDPAWDRYAVGLGILEHSIQASFADGMREYRLLRGPETYKLRYATHDPGLVTVATGHGGAGRAAVDVVAVLARWQAGRALIKHLYPA
jgi:CelD/BcsL family acetyltransferase involved in cellulose biosynthesis